MTWLYYNIYCDESGIQGEGDYWLGALSCSPARAELLRQSLRRVRAQFDLRHEMKWTRVSQCLLPAYTAWTDVLLNDRYARFVVMHVVRGSDWRAWAPNQESRFFKTYYVFLRRQMSMGCRYGAYLDWKPGKPYRWQSLQYAINGAAQRNGIVRHQKQLHTLKALDSKGEDLIQLVDVILGALTSRATAPAKTSLAAHVREHIVVWNNGNRDRYKQYDWTPM